jgi:UDP-glucose 4-epimerase
MKINLLITGGLGYIGSFTAREFIKSNGIKPVSVDNISRGNLFANKFSKNIKMNISNSKLKNILKKQKINTVINLAAYTCVRESIVKKNIYYKNNYLAQIKFINLLKKIGVRNLIFSSSLSIFDKNRIKKKASPYTKYKLSIEKYLKKISANNFKVIILRYPNIIGSDAKGEIGEKNSFITRIVPTFYKNIINKKKNTIFYDFKNKKFPIRNYLHVNDIAKLNIDVVKNIKKFTNNYYIFNITNNKFYSNFDVLANLTKITKTKPNYVLKKMSIKESIKPSYSKKNEINKFVKFKPKISGLKNILNTNIPWFKKIY